MDEWLKIAVLYGVGILVLAIDVFVPSHFLLSVAGLGIIGYGLYQAFGISVWAGAANALVLAVVIPVGLVVAIRNWHRTPIGRRMSPANPTLTEADRLPFAGLQKLIGQVGRAVTFLRPVGTCEFAGTRVECMAESGVIDSGAQVEAVSFSDRTLVVRVAPGTKP